MKENQHSERKIPELFYVYADGQKLKIVQNEYCNFSVIAL